MNSFEKNHLGDFVRDLRHEYDHLPASEPGDWIGQSVSDSLSSLLDHATDEWLLERKGLRVHFERGAIKGHTGPAHSILKALSALNDAVVHLVNESLEKPYAQITDSVRERLGMLLIPATAGSVVMELVCRPTGDVPGRPAEVRSTVDGQTVHPMTDSLQSPAEVAVDRIMDVVAKSVNTPLDASRVLEEALLELPRNSVQALNRFVTQCDEMGSTVEISDRQSENPPVTFIPADARHLKRVIKYLGLDEYDDIFDGEWLTYSDVRTYFDIRIQDGTVVSGRVPASLISESFAALKKFVRVTLQGTQKGGDDAPVRYVLKEIRVLADHVPDGFFDQAEATEAD